MYALAIYHPVTKLIITTHINLTQQEMEIRRELAERSGYTTKTCKDR
jgi:hypothetical protein